MKKSTPKYTTLYTESNPNPNSLKFVANYLLAPEGQTFDYPDAQKAEDSPLAAELFRFPFVQRVFIMSNFVTITKTEEANWHEIAPQLKSFIKEYLEEDKPLFKTSAIFGDRVYDDEPAINQKIRNILDEYVRPAVEGDGGAIAFHSFEGGVVKVLLQGACSGCPSSTMTLKMGIQNLLTRMLPEVKEVVAEGV
ncbi:MAG: NifU family protein [Microscillaceae bacterium]|nr:NifU family protein [Microscillaceae bacterium]